jgi:hypothetical protein
VLVEMSKKEKLIGKRWERGKMKRVGNGKDEKGGKGER